MGKRTKEEVKQDTINIKYTPMNIITTTQMVNKLYEYICDQDDTATSYESLQNRKLPLDTKGLLPDRV